MPYSPTSWVDNVTLGNQTRMNNLETQYTEATNSYNRDMFNPFVLNGLVATKDGTNANQLDVTAGTIYALQSDFTLRRRSYSATTFTTSTPSTIYYLDANPDGTTSWGTSHSGMANYLTICQVTTDTSGNIGNVSDLRVISLTFMPNSLGVLHVPNNFAVNGSFQTDNGSILTDGLGTISGTAPAAEGNPTLALVAGTGLGIGVYYYKVTYTTPLGESAPSAATTITTTSGNQQVQFSTLPAGPAGATKRNIYRNLVGAGSGGPYYFVASVNNNTSTSSAYTDSSSDATISGHAQLPAHPSLGGDLWKNNSGTTVAEIFSDGAVSFDTGAITSDGNGNLFLNGKQVPVTGAGNLANTPLQFIVVGPSSSNLPAAGVKGRVGIVTPFSLP